MSWENLLIDSTTESEKTINIRNVSQQLQSISISIELSRTDRVESIEIVPEQFNLAPSEIVEVLLKLKFNPLTQPGAFEDISGDVVIDIDNQAEVLRVPIWASVTKAPAPDGKVLLVDDDGGEAIENQYIEAINKAGYEITLWNVDVLKLILL